MSANWSISRNSSDRSPVSDDLTPQFGTVTFAAGQVTAVISINIVADDQPEEAEAFVLKLLPNTVTGNAEIDEPMEVSSVSALCVWEGKKKRLHLLGEASMCYAHVCDYGELQMQTWHIKQELTPFCVALLCGCSLYLAK